MDITIKRGDTAYITFELTDMDGEALNLTNCNVLLTIKQRLSDDDDDALLAEVYNGFDDSGIVEIELDKEQTDLPIGKWYYDLQIEDENGNVTSTDRARIKVVQDVTLRNNFSS